MSIYTLELRYIENNPNIDLFEDVKYYEPLEFDNFKRSFLLDINLDKLDSKV